RSALPTLRHLTCKFISATVRRSFIQKQPYAAPLGPFPRRSAAMFQRLQHRTRRAAPSLRHRLELQALDERCVLNSTATSYIATDLVSDQPGVAALTDAHLVNAWGLAVNPTAAGAFWVSDN